MRNIFIFIVVVTVFYLSSTIVAAKNESNNQGFQQGQGTTVNQGSQITSSPSVQNETQNQNQVQTQNQGEEQQLQVQTQEQEQTGNQGQNKGSQNKNQNALDHMSDVANKVQELQQIREEGGLGEQVRQVAQEQNQAQSQIKDNLNKLNSRGQLIKLLMGTDYEVIKNLKTQLEQNQLRITTLEQIQTQLTNQEDITMVQATIQTLKQQNISLQEKVNSEEKTKSMFGWLFKFFAK